MTEKVRLVIWDLDETFWHGTLTEGGIRIVPENCQLVKDLAARGIISSICSKNNFDDVKAVLEREGMWEYFVFPSITWEPKGPRVAAIVEAVQLRAPTILFIDDNPMNLEEVRQSVAGIQVQSHEFIPQIAASPLFAGKDDRELTRLAQYKLLETRKRDEQAAGGDNTDFLRRSDIRVYIEHDVHAHLDRAIELINRTNQLNYTKRRLPEDLEAARQALSVQLRHHGNQAGLVRVVDRYGDYGFVGFYLLRNFRQEYLSGKAPQTLVQYCFSCRTLGMFVEQWLYHHLGEPELTTVGEVLTDLSVPRTIDWVQRVAALDGDAPEIAKIAPEIRLYGGCEVNAIGHYLASRADGMSVAGNFANSGAFVRVNSVMLLNSACARRGAEMEAEAAALGIPYDMMISRYFEDVPPGTVFVFDGGLDASLLRGNFRYRHRDHGWELRVEADSAPLLDFNAGTDDDLATSLAAISYASPADRSYVETLAGHMRRNYESVRGLSGYSLMQSMRQLFDAVPKDCKLFVLLQAEMQPNGEQPVHLVPWIREYNSLVSTVAADYPFVALLFYQDYVEHEGEKRGGDHYDRMVHFRLAMDLIARAPTLPGRAAPNPVATAQAA